MGKTNWRTALISVEKLTDEFGVGAKDQSNPEIARTPRNAFRCSLEVTMLEVERLIGSEAFTGYQFLINSECSYSLSWSEGTGANVSVREGNNPDRRLRPPIVGRVEQNEVERQRQSGCWLGSSHSFKECVTAH